MLKRTPKSEKLDLRLTPEAKRRISEAAAAKHCSVTDFVLRSAIDRADEVLANAALTRDVLAELERQLENDPPDFSRIRRMLKEPQTRSAKPSLT